MIRFLLNAFSHRFFFTLYDGVYELKTIRKTFGVLKNSEYLNGLQGALFCTVKQIRIHNTCEYMNRYNYLKFPDQSKLSQPVHWWVEGEDNTCFVKSKLMDLNNFLIRSNVLNIQFLRNLVTQSHGDHFS